MNASKSVILGLGAAFALSTVFPQSALADEPAARIDRLVAQAGVQQGSPVTASGNQVSVDGMVVVLNGQKAGSSARSGRQVWAGGRVSHVAVDTVEGAQFVSIHTDRATLTTSYTFPGITLQPQADGSVSMVRGDGLVGFIRAPWAKDASGAAVTTRYQVEGSRLVQVLEPTASTVFPVVADPTVVKKWWGSQVRFSRSETQKIGYGASACAVVTALLPDPISKIATVACGALSLAADVALGENKCLAANVFFTGQVVPWYWSC